MLTDLQTSFQFIIKHFGSKKLYYTLIMKI